MNYAAARHLAPPPGEAGEPVLPWESESQTASLRQETWLLSFIDILALLLTLFVLLLAHQDRTSSNPGSGGAASDSSSIEFMLPTLRLGGMGSEDLPALMAADGQGYAMPGDGLIPQDVSTVPRPSGAVEPVSEQTQPIASSVLDPQRGADTELDTPAVDTQSRVSDKADEVLPEEPVQVTTHQADQRPAAPEDDVSGAETAAQQLEVSLSGTVLAERGEISVSQGAVSLDIDDSILFSPASAALSKDGLKLLQELAAVLLKLPYRLSVEGHSDNLPIQTSRYPSNWELSSARAARVTRQLIDLGVPAERIRAIGYGDTRPRSDNDSTQGRAKNRRVTFVLHVDTLEPIS